ncbi:MAG TPA: hypothetical protein VFG86_01940 [Chloroflexota bacterium]|nr:hypothetical protein [Chloroflexota bacterium]
MYRESLALFTRLQDEWGRGSALRALAGLAAEQGDGAAALALYEESVLFFRLTGDTRGLAQALLAYGKLALRAGRIADARRILSEGVARWREVGISGGIVRCLLALGGVAAAEGDSERAARLYGAVATHARAHGVSFGERDEVERQSSMSEVRRLLGSEAFSTAWAAGQATSLDEVIEEALGAADAYPPLVSRYLGFRGSY